jgi:membrane-associated phospholipid phosphatase
VRGVLGLERVRSHVHAACALGLSLALLSVAESAGASESCRAPAPWDELERSGRHLVEPRSLALIAGAAAAPIVLAPGGFDQRARLVAQRELGGRHNLEYVSLATPYVFSGGLLVAYGLGVGFGACDSLRPEAALLQALALTGGTVALLKLSTGRQWPNGGGDPNAPDRLDHPDRARDFTPFTRGLGAWPSGHTALMFAAASAFRGATPELGWLRWLGYPLAVGVGLGMWLGDHHWASDIVSGALLGEAIGGSVGPSFADALNVRGTVVLVPEPGSGMTLRWAGSF